MFTTGPFLYKMAHLMLKGKIIALNGNIANIQTADGQILNIEIDNLEGQAKEGQEVALVAAVLGGEEAGRQELARHLLNELLKG